MDRPAAFTVEHAEDGWLAVLSGDWTAIGLADAGTRLADQIGEPGEIAFDMTDVGRCDTAGALAIVRAADGRLKPEAVKGAREFGRLLELVAAAVRVKPPTEHHAASVTDLLERLGRGLVHVGVDFYSTMVFTGHLLVAIGRVLRDPRRMRWTAFVSHIERAGLDALPIVALTTFFIGAVVAFLGANELEQFGAQVFAVELIAISVLREFNIIITAVLLAGRSASSFAAEIGSMKMSQEIDAMRTMGIDPFEALVLPRFLALLFTIPLLTFVATLAGLVGGMLVSWGVLNLSPSFFFQRIIENVSINNFWVGLSKGPVMALVIAGIGCRQGMEVGGDVESLGRRVTAAVVHAIFSIILIDAIFAMIYMELHV
jgi:phospholipid/cholesterol/gamma-HCH transport system permease protein